VVCYVPLCFIFTDHVFIADDGAARHSCGPDIEEDRFVVAGLSATSWASVTSTVAVRSPALATS
jgi:hypothetical protein